MYAERKSAVVSRAGNLSELRADLQAGMERLARTRPTAVNLFWALGRMRDACDRASARPDADPGAVRAALVREAEALVEEDVAICRRLGAAGAELVPDDARVLASNAFCENAILAYGDTIWTVQPHPEFGNDFIGGDHRRL